MTKKKYDCAVKVGEYVANGEKKNRWRGVGSVLKTEHGHVMLLDRTFNPAGVADPEGRGTVMISFFEPYATPSQAPTQNNDRIEGDDIPF